MTEISDYELIYMIRQGDDAAFSQLLQRYDECSRHLIFHFIDVYKRQPFHSPWLALHSCKNHDRNHE